MTLTESKEELAKGDNAPDVSLPNVVDDSTVNLNDFEGQPVCIIFMCNHCPFVKAKMDEIAELQEDLGDEVPLILINSNDVENYPEDSPENMKELAEEKGYDIYLFDESQEVAKAYGAVCTPDPFVFNGDHELVYHGRINDAMKPGQEPERHDLREVLENVAKGEEVSDWFRPSMGCNIKWK